MTVDRENTAQLVKYELNNGYKIAYVEEESILAIAIHAH